MKPVYWIHIGIQIFILFTLGFFATLRMTKVVKIKKSLPRKLVAIFVICFVKLLQLCVFFFTENVFYGAIRIRLDPYHVTHGVSFDDIHQKYFFPF